MYGYIHSTESMGTVDGPGIRYVVFTAGCPLRCKYCHNPDTWDIKNSKTMTCTEILDDLEKYKEFLKNGGITVSGGEPLVQIDFVTELFKMSKQRNIHTCLDTSGCGFSFNENKLKKFDNLLKFTDLIMLDIKHINPDKYTKLTNGNLSETLNFLEYISNKSNIDIWIRHVILQDWTYKKEYLYHLGYHLGQYKNIKAIDILPYHNMAMDKYQKLGLKYPLSDTPPMTKEHAKKALEVVKIGIKDRLLGNTPQL